jgi:hypothetical protein
MHEDLSYRSHRPDRFEGVDLLEGDGHDVVVDPQATYFGTPVTETSLVTGDGAVLGTVRFADWPASR